MNIANVLISATRKFHSKPAIIFRDQPISFLALCDNVFKLANGLLKSGIKKSDKVAIYLPNNPEYIYSYLALFSIGATVVPLDYMFTEDELASCLSHCQAKLLIAKEKEALSLENLKKRLPGLENIIVLEKSKSNFKLFQDVLNSAGPLPVETEINDRDPALIMYT